MIQKILIALSVAFFAVVSSVGAQAGHRGAVPSCAALDAIDPDSDGRMTTGEAVKRGIHVFKALNADGDRTLEADELHGRLSPAAFAWSDRNKDGKLYMGEWIRRIVVLFNKANADRDGTIECDELYTGYGRGLKRMLR